MLLNSPKQFSPDYVSNNSVKDKVYVNYIKQYVLFLIKLWDLRKLLVYSGFREEIENLRNNGYQRYNTQIHADVKTN